MDKKQKMKKDLFRNFYDSALTEEHFSLIERKAARLRQGNLSGGLLWGCEVEILANPCWAGACLALHGAVREGLAVSERQALLPRDKAYFENLLSGRGGFLFGAFAGMEMVGLVALREEKTLAVALEKRILTCSFGPDGAEEPPREAWIQVVQSLCVHPDFARQKVSCFLLKAALAQASQRKGGVLFAQVAESNQTSWLQFMAHDFAIVGRWTAGHARYLLRHFTPEQRAKRRVSKRFDVAALEIERREKESALLSEALTEKLPLRLAAFWDRKESRKGQARIVFE